MTLGVFDIFKIYESNDSYIFHMRYLALRYLSDYNFSIEYFFSKLCPDEINSGNLEFTQEFKNLIDMSDESTHTIFNKIVFNNISIKKENAVALMLLYKN